jgi:hypothetical protein
MKKTKEVRDRKAEIAEDKKARVAEDVRLTKLGQGNPNRLVRMTTDKGERDLEGVLASLQTETINAAYNGNVSRQELFYYGTRANLEKIRSYPGVDPARCFIANGASTPDYIYIMSVPMPDPKLVFRSLAQEEADAS